MPRLLGTPLSRQAADGSGLLTVSRCLATGAVGAAALRLAVQEVDVHAHLGAALDAGQSRQTLLQGHSQLTNPSQEGR